MFPIVFYLGKLNPLFLIYYALCGRSRHETLVYVVPANLKGLQVKKEKLCILNQRALTLQQGQKRPQNAFRLSLITLLSLRLQRRSLYSIFCRYSRNERSQSVTETFPQTSLLDVLI